MYTLIPFPTLFSAQHARPHIYALLLGVTACSKGDDAPTPSPTPTPTPTPAPARTLTLNYNNLGLDMKTYNLGAGIRVYVDQKPLLLGGAVDTTFYISPQDAASMYPKTLTVKGNTLTVEVGFYNVKGTPSNTLDYSGKPLKLPMNAIFTLVPVVNNTALTTPLTSLGSGYGAPLTYDNGKNPTKRVSFDITKL